MSFAEARKNFKTALTRRELGTEPVAEPPATLFRTVAYPSTAGQQPAYLSLDPQDGKKHPAIVWITGGDCATIGDVWEESPPENDQTASAYRKAGIVMMFPSLRGGNQNPSFKEGFYGEVDDVLSAADFLAKQEFVDPNRIYLGGHSTGGTLVLLVAEASPRFRAVFSFGPVDNVAGYGQEMLPFNAADNRELEMRAPIRWLQSIKSPVFVMEGAVQGNLEPLQAMAKSPHPSAVSFLVVPGVDHFSILAPANQLIAGKILKDDGPTCNLTITEQELASAPR